MRDVVRAASKTGGGAIASLALGAAATKIIAVILGPAGVGLFSLLRQTQQAALTLGSLNGQTALVQGLSSREGERQNEFLVTSFWILSLSCLATCTLIFLFPQSLARWVTGESDAQTVRLFRWLVLPVSLTVLGAFLGGVLNAHRAIGRLALVQIAGTAALALVAYPASRLARGGHPLALVWMLAAAAVSSAVVGLLYVRREGWLRPIARAPRAHFGRDVAVHFLSMAGTMLVTGFIQTGTQLAVRAMVTRRFSLEGAGVFDVAWTLSMMYVTLVLGSFSTYYLPTLARTRDETERNALVTSLLRFTILIMVPLVVSVVVLKPAVIGVLYSQEFKPSLKVMRWMLVGDYFKVLSWVLAMPMLAFRDMKVFFSVELVWNLGILACAFVATTGGGSLSLIGVGFLVLYIGNLLFAYYYSHSRFAFMIDRSTLLRFIAGLAIVMGASVTTWRQTSVHWVPAILWILFAIGFGLATLNRHERSEVWAALRLTR